MNDGNWLNRASAVFLAFLVLVALAGCSANKDTLRKSDQVCFSKDKLQGGRHLWAGEATEKCIPRSAVYCYVDEKVNYPPLICIDKRDGSIVSFTD